MFPEYFQNIYVIPISKNTATHQFFEPVPFYNRSVAILKEINITLGIAEIAVYFKYYTSNFF